jgi:hypothetical protein
VLVIGLCLEWNSHAVRLKITGHVPGPVRTQAREPGIPGRSPA